LPNISPLCYNLDGNCLQNLAQPEWYCITKIERVDGMKLGFMSAILGL
jgi:hypothetical protein